MRRFDWLVCGVVLLMTLNGVVLTGTVVDQQKRERAMVETIENMTATNAALVDAVDALESEVATLSARLNAVEKNAGVQTRTRTDARTNTRTRVPDGWRVALASWYGTGFYGKRTASGEILTPDSMTVAHPSLPFGTVVEIRYNGRVVRARVNDRFPGYKGRTFDLAGAVARALGFDGVHKIEWRIVR